MPSIPTRKARLWLALALALAAIPALKAINRQPNDARLTATARTTLTALSPVQTEDDDGPILIAGDSHALALAKDPICGEQPADGGVAGITAIRYAEAWNATAPKATYRAIVVSLGSNDQQIRRHPEQARTHRAQIRAMRHLIVAMQRRTPLVVVLAIPPNTAGTRAVTAIGIRERNGELAALCADLGCRYVDPYAATREADGQTMRSGYSDDGVHYKTYAPIRANIKDHLCPVTRMSQSQKT
jgi:hypothetical protein